MRSSSSAAAAAPASAINTAGPAPAPVTERGAQPLPATEHQIHHRLRERAIDAVQARGVEGE